VLFPVVNEEFAHWRSCLGGLSRNHRALDSLQIPLPGS
jgi:hypothetical protein